MHSNQTRPHRHRFYQIPHGVSETVASEEINLDGGTLTVSSWHRQTTSPSMLEGQSEGAEEYAYRGEGGGVGGRLST